MARKKVAKKDAAAHAATIKVGISSYSESEFELLKQVALDPDSLGRDFAEYRAGVEKTKATFKAAGVVTIVEVPLTVEEIKAYCLQTGQPNIFATRSALAQSILQLHFGKGE
jgi:hypothetical protein